MHNSFILWSWDVTNREIIVLGIFGDSLQYRAHRAIGAYTQLIVCFRDRVLSF